MQLFVALTRWTDYIAGLLACAEIDERAHEAVVAKAEAVVILRGTGEKDDKVTRARAERETDPTVLKWRAKLDEAYIYRKAMQVMFTSAERDAAVVSRELTRRVGKRENNERRADRWRP